MSSCIVIVPLLQLREQPNLTSPVHQTVHAGTTLVFVQRVQGATVHINNSNNANWGKSPDNFFFPLGGTNHPNG